MIVRWIDSGDGDGDNAINKMNCHDFRRLYNPTKSDNSIPISWRVAPLRFNLIVYNNKSRLCRRKGDGTGTYKTFARMQRKSILIIFLGPPAGKSKSTAIHAGCVCVCVRSFVTQSQSMTMINTFSTLGPSQAATHRWTIKSSKLFIMHMAHIRKIVSVRFLLRPKLISQHGPR